MAKHGNAENLVMSQDSYQALCRLKKLARQDMHSLLSELEAAKNHRGEANRIEVARFWKSHAPANFEEKLVSAVFDEYMKLFVDRPQKARSGVRSKVKKFVDAFGRSYIGLITAKQVEDWFRQLPGSKVYANKVRSEVIVSKDLRDKEIITSWENDVMRHSFCSYLLAKEQNIGLVAEQAATAPR